MRKWTPNSVCSACYKNVIDFGKEKRPHLQFDSPMIWKYPGRNHRSENCYACKNTVKGMNLKKAQSHIYQSVPSALIPKLYSAKVLVSSPHHELAEDKSSNDTESDDHSEFNAGSLNDNPILITHDRLDFIVSKLELSQRKSEELARFLKEHNVLAPNFNISRYRKRQSALQQFFAIDETKTFSYCDKIEPLMQTMEIGYVPSDWRLFIDSSKESLKAVLLHKTNEKPSVPIAYSTETKETYEKLELILKSVNYNDHNWRICCDLKVVAILCGLQSGYTTHMCFLCNWNSRYKGNQYKNRSWKKRLHPKVGQMNVVREALVPPEKIMLPLLHIKLGVVKSFIKTVVNNKQNPDHALDVLSMLRNEIFNQKISIAKLKEGI